MKKEYEIKSRIELFDYKLNILHDFPYFGGFFKNTEMNLTSLAGIVPELAGTH